ncbi:MAG: helix-turn-helix transcriptional regulator [Clostridia bacterium]|nr:helix-turn-helix transcriptional regulator [Clostridia bacterium]
MEIGKRLKDMRTGMGMTQEECAEKLGVARQTLSSWESGRTFPDIRSVVAISDLFGVSLDALLKEDAAAVDRLEDAADEAQARRNQTRRLPFLAYMTLWAFIVALFWLIGPRTDIAALAYSIIALDVVFSLITLVFSFLIGAQDDRPRTKWFFILFFSLFYFLADFVTLDLSDFLIRGVFSLPHLSGLLFGALFSFAGLGAGEIARLVLSARKKKN